LHAPLSNVRWRARLRGAMSGAAVRVVAHIDLDAFYVQCEARSHALATCFVRVR
jgi:hypothetical protein